MLLEIDNINFFTWVEEIVSRTDTIISRTDTIISRSDMIFHHVAGGIDPAMMLKT